MRTAFAAALTACCVAAPSIAAPQTTQPAVRVAGASSGPTASAYDDQPIGGGVDANAATPLDASLSEKPAAPAHSVGFDLGRMAIALAIVLALILGARWLFTHFFAGARAPATSKAVKVLSRTSLAPRQQILLLQVGRRVVVVGESNGNLTTLAQLDDPDEVAGLVGQLQEEQIQRAASFGGMFGRLQRKYTDDEHAPRDLADLEGHADSPPGEEMDPAQAKSELSGLVEKVRSIRSQLGP